MKKIILIALSIILLSAGSAYAEQKIEAAPHGVNVQEAHAATLDDETTSEDERPKKKKTTKKAKKSKKAKKHSN